MANHETIRDAMTALNREAMGLALNFKRVHLEGAYVNSRVVLTAYITLGSAPATSLPLIDMMSHDISRLIHMNKAALETTVSDTSLDAMFTLERTAADTDIFHVTYTMGLEKVTVEVKHYSARQRKTVHVNAVEDCRQELHDKLIDWVEEKS